ncbi:hypothetical protein LJU32_22455 [Pseudomonas sp. B21_DOA]|nr:hypothetical protein LJU32_22455 [Pseudomonas sp. B21_DOA]
MATIGKGGTGVLVGPGNNGGATSFGSHVTAPGGIGGGLSANVAPPLYLGQTPNSQPAVGATVKNGQGKGGGGVIGPKTDFVVSGEGGPSEMGPGVIQSQPVRRVLMRSTRGRVAAVPLRFLHTLRICAAVTVLMVGSMLRSGHEYLCAGLRRAGV